MLFQSHLVSSFRQLVCIYLSLSSLLSLSNPSCHFTSSRFSCWESITTTWPSSTAPWSLSTVCLGCLSSVREAPSGWELQEHHTFNSTLMHVEDQQWLHICNSVRGFFKIAKCRAHAPLCPCLAHLFTKELSGLFLPAAHDNFTVPLISRHSLKSTSTHKHTHANTHGES